MPLTLDTLIQPTKGTRFSKLRDAQDTALQAYVAGAHRWSDMAIELPTGAGKTLIALLILEYWRKEGKRVAILTGNKTLAHQIESETRDLGVPTVRFEGRGDEISPKDRRSYSRASAIAIMNYWVYINQKPSVDPAEVLVLDDAQLAEGALSSLFSMRIGRYEHTSLFEESMKLFGQYTDSPVADDCVKGLDRGPWGPTDLVPFSDYLSVYDEFEALVDGEVRKAGEDAEWKDLRFRWGRVRPRAQQALVFLSQDEVVVRPYIYPSQDFPHLAEPFQRIYMSATLHDPDDLRRRLGTPAIRKLEIPPELVQEEDGRRLFVFNQTPSPSSRAEPPDEILVPLRELLKVAKKSVWLCSSGDEARRWRTWLLEQFPRKAQPTTWELTSVGDEFDQFCSASEGHLFIAGRFEGMDFPDKICRLAIFPSLPRATGALERFVTEQLKDASFQKTRMLERIKQGIGRCTRGRQDYAVYYFLDSRFYAEMESRAFLALQGDRTRKQVELGLELTQDGMGAVVPFASKFLDGNFVEFDERELAVRPPAPGPAVKTTGAGTVSDEVEGWRALFERRDFVRAAVSFEAVSAKLADAEREHRGFWKYMEAFAEYLRHDFDGQPGALDTCLSHLERAILEGGSSSWFNRLRKAKNTLAGRADAVPDVDQSAVLDRWDELVEKYPHFKGRFFKWQAALKAYMDGTHNQVCEALQTLGHLLGFGATRPTGSGAADGRWVGYELAITLEAKIEVDRESISLADVNQADGHQRAAKMELRLPDENIAAVVVASMNAIDPAASRALGTVRILPLEMVAEIQGRLEPIMRSYWKGWSREDAGTRSRLRALAAKQLPQPGWLLRAIKSSGGPFLTEAELFKEWPK
jgi:hypothetical protein